MSYNCKFSFTNISSLKDEDGDPKLYISNHPDGQKSFYLAVKNHDSKNGYTYFSYIDPVDNDEWNKDDIDFEFSIEDEFYIEPLDVEVFTISPVFGDDVKEGKYKFKILVNKKENLEPGAGGGILIDIEYGIDMFVSVDQDPILYEYNNQEFDLDYLENIVRTNTVKDFLFYFFSISSIIFLLTYFYKKK